MNYNRLKLSQVFGHYSHEQLEKGVAGALALTPFVNYKGERSEVQRYFDNVAACVEDFLFALNEVQPYNVDKAKQSAFAVFCVRYYDVIHAKSSLLFSTGNNIADKLNELMPCEIDKELVTLLLDEFKALVQAKLDAR